MHGISKRLVRDVRYSGCVASGSRTIDGISQLFPSFTVARESPHCTAKRLIQSESRFIKILSSKIGPSSRTRASREDSFLNNFLRVHWDRHCVGVAGRSRTPSEILLNGHGSAEGPRLGSRLGWGSASVLPIRAVVAICSCCLLIEPGVTTDSGPVGDRQRAGTLRSSG